MNNLFVHSFGFTIAIGDLGILVDIEPGDLQARLSSQYRDFIQDIEPKLSIHFDVHAARKADFLSPPGMLIGEDQLEFRTPVIEGLINFTGRSGELQVYSNSPEITIDYALRNILATLAVRDGGFMFHGAGVNHQGVGCLFFGPSGSGKTTIAKNSSNDVLLNDDLVIVKKINQRWMMHATPFYHSGQQKPTCTSSSLDAMFRLIQSRHVVVETISSGQSLAEVLANIPVVSTRPIFIHKLVAQVEDLVASIPVYRLHFLPDNKFWEVVAPFLDGHNFDQI